jgi:ParB-like nuclease domain
MNAPFQIDRSTLIQIDHLIPNTYNPNVQTPQVSQAQRESIEEFGYLSAVLVRPHPTVPGSFEIIDGAHRVKECRDLGFETLECDVIHGLTDAQAKRLTLIYIETKGTPDRTKLKDVLEQIRMETPDLAEMRKGLPYTVVNLNEMLVKLPVLQVPVSPINPPTYSPPAVTTIGNPKEHSTAQSTFTTPNSYTRMFQLFFKVEEYEEIKKYIEEFHDILGTKTSSECVLMLMRHFYAEMINAKS